MRTLPATSQVTSSAENPSSSLINFLWYLKEGQLQGTDIYRPKKIVQVRKKKNKRRMIQLLTSDATSVPSAFH